jgi:NADH:ubiquinone oxidoreductase subunit F (NADH-binding)
MTLAAQQLPRILAGLVPSGPIGLTAHESIHGRLTGGSDERSRGRRRLVDPLISDLELSGLRGMGGGSFPTATKIAAVAAQGGRRVVLVNGTEGEPLSHKDRLLLSRLPHLVLDGAIVAARLIGSREIVLAFDEGSPAIGRIVDRAIEERPEFAGKRAIAAVAQPAPSGYLIGQESALVNTLDGRAPKPSVMPPYPFERGLGKRPTLISNAETFAQLALIARHDAEWYRAIGTRSAPGSRLITVAGAVMEPGVLEVAGGTELSTLLRVAGGQSEPLRGFLLGGYAGTWIAPADLDLRLDEAELRSYGLTLGPGIVFALPQSACPVAEVAGITRWMQQQSAKQCGPCIFGLAAIADALEQLCNYGDGQGTYQRVERWCEMVTGRGACAHPDGVGRFVSTALQSFRDTFDDHARHGRCDRCLSTPWLPVTQVARESVVA